MGSQKTRKKRKHHRRIRLSIPSRNPNSSAKDNSGSQRVSNAPKRTTVAKYRKPFQINPGIVVFLVIFVYIIFLVLSFIRSERITPYEVKLGSLSIDNVYDAVALREEQVVDSDYSGYINYYAREGEKVAKNSMVYTVDSSGKLSELVANDPVDGTSLSDEDLTELKGEISDFSTDFDPAEFKATYEFKYDMEGTVLKLANRSVLASIDELRNENYGDSIDFGYSPYSGVLVYSTDGYEDLTCETIMPDQINALEYEKKQYHSNDLISEGDNAYKIITSELWSMIVEIDEEKAESLADENYIEVRFLKNNYKSWAAVKILRQNGKIYAQLDFNNSMITFATDRFLEIELLDSAAEGLKIPNSAIVELPFYLIPVEYMTKGGNTGDEGFMLESYSEDGTLSTDFVSATIYNEENGEYYVDESAFNLGDRIIMPDTGEVYTVSKQANLIGVYNINKGYADFKQITIIDKNEEYSIVKSNSKYGLSVYDHIVLKGDSVKENQFIYE